MRGHISYVGSAIVAVMLATAARVEAQVPGRNCCLDANRGVAICSPLESPDGPEIWIVRCFAKHDCWDQQFYPYYSPLIPISQRWRTLDLVSYYPGYCRRMAPVANYWAGAGVYAQEGAAHGNFGGYTGAATNEEWLLHLGGRGPDGGGTNQRTTPDIVDALESQRGSNGFYFPSQATR